PGREARISKIINIGLRRRSMHCPNCGAVALIEQKFCRACGFGLEKVAQLFAEHASEENFESASDSGEELPKGLRHWFSLFITLFLSFSVYLGASGNISVFGIVCFIVLLLGILALGAHIEFESGKLSKHISSQPSSSISAPTTKKLPPQPGLEMNASVTEQTTATLAERIES